MDTPLAAAVHKENVHIGGGKVAVTMKQDKLKTVKTAGKERKALADRRSAYGPVAAVSKDIDLKMKSAIKGNEIKKNPMMQGKQHAAAADVFTTKKQLGPCHILTDEEIKQCCEWAEDGIEDMGGYAWSEKDEAIFLENKALSEMMPSDEEFEKSISSDGEGYETDEPHMNISVSDSDDTCLPGETMYKYGGCPSSCYLLLELDDYPLSELKLNDEFEEFSTDNVAEIDGTQSLGSIGAAK